MNNKRIIKNIGISMIMKPISLILSLIYTPMALNFLGEAKYGVWAIILNIVTWITIFDIGIGNGLRNRLTESCAVGNEKEAQIYISTAYLGTTILSTIFFIIIISIWNMFDLSAFFNLTVPGENVNISITVSVLFICINFVLGLSKTSAFALQKAGAISITGVVSQVVQIVGIFFIAKYYNQSLLAVAIMYGCASLIDNIILYIYLINNRNYLVPRLKNVNFKYMKSLMTLGIGFFTMQICSVVLNTTDNLLISNLYGSSEVTPYNMVYKIFYLFVTIHSIIIMPMWSAYTEAATKGEIDWIKRTMKKINWITVAFSIGVIIAIFVFEPFAYIWLGKKLEYGKMLIVIVAVYMIAQMFANNYSSFLCGVGHIKVSMVLAIFQAIVNIPLSIFFAKIMNMKLSGIIMGSFCVMIVNIIVLPIVTNNWFKNQEKKAGD